MYELKQSFLDTVVNVGCDFIDCKVSDSVFHRTVDGAHDVLKERGWTMNFEDWSFLCPTHKDVPHYALRDRQWCRALIATLSVDDIARVTTEFNRIRKDDCEQPQSVITEPVSGCACDICRKQATRGVAKVDCPTCGTENPVDDRAMQVCTSCGTPFTVQWLPVWKGAYNDRNT